jgi:predicted AAA+ superfamily ATPase
MMTRDLFDKERLPPSVDAFLYSTNPWWQGKPGPVIPSYRRWAFHSTLKKLKSGLAPAVVLRGPRQVGKTTLQLQMIEYLIREEGVRSNRILRVQFDEIPSLSGLNEPILTIARWFENRILGNTFNEVARQNFPAFLFFDEVQNLLDWAPQLKALTDHHTVKVLVTGSSALRIEAGRDSLAGRVAQVDLGTLLPREIIAMRFGEEFQPILPENGLEALLHAEFWRDLQSSGKKRISLRDQGFKEFSQRGGYPIAHAHPDIPWPEIADQLNETVIQRAIQHDLRVGRKGQKRDQQLLEEVYRLSCRYAGQSPGQGIFVPEIRQALQANIGWNRIVAYLKFLDGAMLLKLVRPLELRLKRSKGNSKICLCDHGLRASWLQEVIPLDVEGLRQSSHLSDLAGHIAESATGYFLGGVPHLDLAHFPERGPEPEVDFILTIGENRIPLEVKYRQHIDPHRDTVGLRAFIEKRVYHAPFALLVTMLDDVSIPDPRIVPVSLPSLLLLR